MPAKNLLLTLLFFFTPAHAQNITLIIHPDKKTTGATPITITAETATTHAQRRKGLSGRTQLADKTGMLFTFTPPQTRPCFWMKNTHIPLTALFIAPAGSTGTIHTKHTMTPRSTTLHCAAANTETQHVLEISTKNATNINIGDTIQLSLAPPATQ